ncbi:MAG: rhomboid family protein [Verrucomicrobia bacterium]|nr:rhomboid family protein [Verrucomicrobiota bacterium]
MSSVSIHQTCLNHPSREAAALCPKCKRSFCRECITEHDYRMICANCLAEHREESVKVKREIRLPLMPVLQIVIGVIVIWTVYYQIGEILVEIPTELHDGKLWEQDRF